MKTNPNSKKLDIYEMVTRQILRNLASGVIPWRQTWTARKGQAHPFTNRFTGKPYSFLNTLLLGEPGQYATFKQIKDAGGSVVKGSRSKTVIYWGEFTPKENREEEKRLEAEGKDTSHLKVRFPKYYNVFNMKDVEGVETKEEEQHVMTGAQDPTDVAEMVIDDYTVNEQVAVTEDDSLEPMWDPAGDTVSVPTRAAFTYEEDFYALLFENLVHSTATEERCDRKQELQRMREGSVSVKEELIAEMGASMILSVAGLKRKETHDQISAEIQKWTREFNNDYRLVVQASYGAERAAKLILGNYAA